MEELKLRIYPHNDLTKVCDPVQQEEFGTFSLETLCASMVHIMRTLGGLGLAANQVGVMKRIFVFEKNATTEGNESNGVIYPEVFINPEISETPNTKKVRFKEGCLSFPGCYPILESAICFELTYYDIDGNKHILEDFKCDNHYGVVFYHEIMHLDGKTIIDKANFIDKQKIITKMNKLRKKL